MAVATFDTLKFANTLKAAGVPPQQAEAQATAFAEVMQINLKDLVTKEDLQQGVKELRQDMHAVRDELRREIKEEAIKANAKTDTQGARLEGEIKQLKWMIGVATTGIIGVLIRLFFFHGP